MLVYLVRNLVNGKVYVGKTTRTLAHRWCNHKSLARRDGTAFLQTAIRCHADHAEKGKIVSPLPPGTVFGSAALC